MSFIYLILKSRLSLMSFNDLTVFILRLVYKNFPLYICFLIFSIYNVFLISNICIFISLPNIIYIYILQFSHYIWQNPNMSFPLVFSSRFVKLLFLEETIHLYHSFVYTFEILFKISRITTTVAIFFL